MEKTLKNLTKAFIGESQARNRYTFYAKIAKKEGYVKLSQVFLLTAENEKQHAKRLFEHIQELKEKLGNNEEILVEAAAPTTYGNTEENLEASINGEEYEETEMYPEFAKIAEEEGLTKISQRLKSIAIAEKHHKERFQAILNEIKKGTLLKKEEKVVWVCMECGYVHIGPEPPEKCPSCDHPKEYFELKTEKF
ncbi:rubrerythrin family protein [Candidatus Pacearchaeota archaeon ex4484_71]|nr:MAG: rubrerythrin family protein [Candidatus Pacearchaeota archaeon ex4484_71]